MQITIETFDGELNPTLKAKIEVGNDSFSHEFGSENYEDYDYIEYFEWNTNDFTETENSIINTYISIHFDELESYYIRLNPPGDII